MKIANSIKNICQAHVRTAGQLKCFPLNLVTDSNIYQIKNSKPKESLKLYSVATSSNGGCDLPAEKQCIANRISFHKNSQVLRNEQLKFVQVDNVLMPCRKSWFRQAMSIVFTAAGVYLAYKVFFKFKSNWTCHARQKDFYLYEEATHGDAFLTACKTGDVKAIESYIAKGEELDKKCKYGWTALMTAVVNGHVPAVELLLEAGADPNIQDDYNPVLKKNENKIFNISNSIKSMAARKLEFSDDLDEEVSFAGCSALHYASLMGHHSLISLLYQYGVDGSLENGKGYTAAELGTDKSKAQILALEAERKKKRNSEVFRNVNLKEVLTTELVGQRLAIEQVSSVVNRLEMGWTNCKHPMVLLFVGATGLGKTEMAKRLAQYLRGNSKTSFVHVNLSEYQTEHEAAKFIGSPPGYVGYSESGDGQLISLLAKNPKAVVLFDEADKAHPNVLTTLLQLFDEGRLTSGSGKSIDCPEAVFVLTANLAIDQIKDFGDGLRKFFSPQSIESGNNNRMQDYVHYFKSRLLHGPLRKAFKRDELLGRINELAIFLPFSKAEQRKLIETQLCQVRSLAAKNHGITLTWDSSLYDFLLKTFNQSYGARHMRHEIDRKVVNRLSTAFDEGLCRPGEFLHLELHPDLGDDSIKHMKDQRIRLCRISPLNTKEYLDIRFADFEELFRLEAS